MYKKVGNLTIKSIIASILVLATVFVYVIGDNFSFLAYFKDDNTVENTIFDTGYDGLRSISDLTLAETGTEMGKIGEDLSSGFEKLVSDCSYKKTFSSGKSEFIDLISSLKKRSLDELDSTNNGTEEYENYRAFVVSGFEEIEGYAKQLNEDNSEEILGKIEDTVSFEEPYVGLADDLPFSNVAVDEVKEEKFVPERSASSYAPENTDYSQADLEFTNDAVINDEIKTEFADYATTLEVYQYIKNNYMPEFYYGSRKGSIGAFEEKAGNDYDLSSLLIAVLRDRNIPARYVRGNIEITAEQAIQWTGAEDINSAARIIAALGIPVTTLTSENGIIAVRLEHVWVEAYVPYTDYRGTGNNAGDSLWIPLDVSFKCLVNNEGVDLSTLDDYINDESNYISSDTVINDIEVGDFADYFKGGESALAKYILENNYGGGTKEEVFGGREIKSEDLGYLPLTLPYSVSEIITSFDDIPTELTDTLSFSLAGNTVSDFDYFGSTSINKTFYTPDIYGKRIILAYAPATADDGELLAKYNGLFNTPAYLLKLKPQLIIDGEVVAEGFTCNAGYSQKYSITTHNSSPYTQDGNVENSVTAGGIYCIALDYGNISAASLQNSADNMEALKTTATEGNIYTDEVMGEMLNSVAKAYFTQLDQLNSVAAGQYNVVAARDLSVGIVGFNVNVVYTFNKPTELNEGGIFLDIGRDVHSVISVENNSDNEKKYMLLTGMYASAMEHGVIEQITGVEAVSTIKAFEYAGKNNIPLHSVTKDNLTDELNVLNVSEKVKQDIRTAVNSGKLVIIPEETLNINQWSGVGYMVLDTDTFACAYMISGGLAGGSMTWDQALSEYLLYVGIGLLVGLLFELASCILTGWLGAAFMAVKIVMLGIWIYQLYQLYQQWKATKEPVFLQEILVQLLAGITVAGIFGACGSKLKGEIAEIAAKLKASPFWGKPIGGGGTGFVRGSSTLSDWSGKEMELAKESPIEIPDNADVRPQSKTGYEQISYKWSADGYKYEVRWHTKTPGAPEGQGNTWVVTRTTPGTATGQPKTTHILVGDTWVPRYQWQAAITAFQNGTATPEQLSLLENGHWPAP